MSDPTYEQAALRRIRDALRRYRHIPGDNDGIELGDWTVMHRLCGSTGPTRNGLADPPGTYPPGSRIATPEQIAALRRVLEWVHDLPRTIPPDGQPGRDLAALAALIGDDR